MATLEDVMKQVMDRDPDDEGKVRGKSKSVEDEGESCPLATQDITVNLKNRAKAIDSADYGPENPDLDNDEFWEDKAEEWDVSVEDAKQSRCGNCSAFNQEESMLECIAEGIGDEGDAEEFIDKADLGYCEIFDFKCAASRTCDAWVTESDEGDDGDERGEKMPLSLLTITLSKKK